MRSMRDIKISLIIPCWNAEQHYVERAVESVDRQTFDDYEVIIVDDGSQDKYHRILEDIVSTREKYSLITVDHGGVSRARNIGIKNAKGSYIAFLDADDFLDERFFELEMAVAEKEDADFVIGGTLKVFSEEDYKSKRLKRQGCGSEVFSGDGVKALKRYFIGYAGRENRIYFPSGSIGKGAWSRLVRACIMRDALFPEGMRIGEDVIWHLRVLDQCHKVVIVKEVLYWYWDNPSSATHGHDNPHIYQDWLFQLTEVRKQIDLSDDYFFSAYAERIYEGMYWIWYSSMRCCKSSPEIKAALYRDEPWILFKSPRVLHVCSSKRIKAYSCMYRMHFLFAFLYAKEAAMNVWKKRKKY